MVKLSFEELKDIPNTFVIKEIGKDTKDKKYETIGFIFLENKDLIFLEEYSGILGFEEIEQIYKFIKSK
jgi:hypothetical protein